MRATALKMVHELARQDPRVVFIGSDLGAGTMAEMAEHGAVRRTQIVACGLPVGVVGLGGLGHMGLKLAHSFGAHVVQFTTSKSKDADALRL